MWGWSLERTENSVGYNVVESILQIIHFPPEEFCKSRDEVQFLGIPRYHLEKMEEEEVCRDQSGVFTF